MSNVNELHEKISKLSLGDLCLLVGNAINEKMDDKKIEILLIYLETAIIKEKYLRNLGMK